MRSPDHMEEAAAAEEEKPKQLQQTEEENSSQGGGGGGGGWGGWGFSTFVFSDLQKAAEEISRNAVAVAKNAAKSITDTDIQPQPDDSETKPVTVTLLKEDATLLSQVNKDGGVEESDNNNILLRNSALDRLEKASEDSLLGQASQSHNYSHFHYYWIALHISIVQGLKVLDNSVESFASGAWLALGSAWKGSSTLVHKLEHSASNLADSIQHGGLPVNASSLAPSIIETGKSFTAKGIQVLERVGKETMELLITETGLEVEKPHEEFDHQSHEEQFEDITFDRCFYIYGGPEQLEELEALFNHYALLFNRKKAKLVIEQKSFYDGKLKQVQQILNLGTEMEENGVDPEKGKHIEMTDDVSGFEMKALHDSSVSKAADMAAGFSASLGSRAANEIIQQTNERLETVHAEGVHRLSEICCFVVSNVLMLGKSVISNANKSKSEDTMDDVIKVDWPEDSVSKAKILRCKVEFMSGNVESVSNSFIKGISEIIEAYQAAIASVSSGVYNGPQENTIQEKANMISNHLSADRTTALGKIQDALQYLSYVVLSSSMPTL